MSDADRLANLSGQLGYPATVRDIQVRLSLLLSSPDHLVAVAVDRQAQVVGWVHAAVVHHLISDSFVQVVGLVVVEELRSSGIGGRLLAHAEEWAGTKGVQVVRVRTNVTRTRAHAFYNRAGYRLSKTSHLFSKALAKGNAQ